MMNKTNMNKENYLLREKGSVAIEFSMVFIPFIISILFIAELCRVAYLSSTLDLILSESGKIASMSTAPENYQKHFTKEVNSRIKQWPLLSRDVDVDLSILYCDSLETMIRKISHCSSNITFDKPLALYRLSIDYQPLFFIFPREITVRELSRKIVFVQEFLRDTTGENNV